MRSQAMDVHDDHHATDREDHLFLHHHSIIFLSAAKCLTNDGDSSPRYHLKHRSTPPAQDQPSKRTKRKTKPKSKPKPSASTGGRARSEADHKVDCESQKVCTPPACPHPHQMFTTHRSWPRVNPSILRLPSKERTPLSVLQMTKMRIIGPKLTTWTGHPLKTFKHLSVLQMTKMRIIGPMLTTWTGRL